MAFLLLLVVPLTRAWCSAAVTPSVSHATAKLPYSKQETIDCSIAMMAARPMPPVAAPDVWVPIRKKRSAIAHEITGRICIENIENRKEDEKKKKSRDD